jgi:hypothetical protein
MTLQLMSKLTDITGLATRRYGENDTAVHVSGQQMLSVVRKLFVSSGILASEPQRCSQVALMRALPPPEGSVIVCGGGELHVTPLTECPECHGPLPYLSINNGFTRKEDAGKLQQWVWFHLAAYWIRVALIHHTVHPL